MAGQRRIFLLIGIMVAVAVGVAGVASAMLYRVALDQQRERLIEAAESRAGLIEALMLHEEQEAYPEGSVYGGAFEATLSQIVDAHEQFKGFGETGEYTLAKLQDDQIVFLLSHRHFDLDSPRPVSLDSGLAEPMRRALAGESGTMIGLDYRGEVVLAAYEPVEDLGLGIVAKIDMAEIRAPFVRAGIVTALVALSLVLVGALLFVRVTNPVLEKIQESEERFRSVAQTATDAIISADRQGNIISWNRAAQSMFGHAAEETIGKPLTLIIPERLCEAHKHALQEVALTGKSTMVGESVELVGKRRNGSEFPIELSLSMWVAEGKPFFGAIVRDITERKQAEEALRESEERFRTIFDSAPIGINILDDEGRPLRANRFVQDMLGYTETELRSMVFADYTHPDDVGESLRMAEELKEGKKPHLRFEKRYIRKDGVLVWVDLAVSAVRSPEGEFQYYIAMIEDITERKRAVEALRESEERLSVFMDSATDSFYLLDENLHFVEINQQGLNIIGKSREEVIGQDIRKVVPDVETSGRYAQHMEVMRTGKPFEVENFVPHPVFGDRTFMLKSFKVGDGIGVIASDITERKQTEEALRRRADEMTALQATVLDITTQRDLPSLLQTVVKRAVRLLDAAGGGLYLCDPIQEEARCVVSYNTPQDYTGTVLKYGEGAAGAVALSGEPLIIDDYRTWSGRASIYEQEQPFTAVLSAPMIWQGEVTGVIHVLEDVESREFTRADLELLTLFANHAAIAVESTRLYEQAQKDIARLKRAEGALRESEEKYRNLFNDVPVGLYQTTRDGQFVDVNVAFAELFGYSDHESLLATSAVDAYVNPDDRARWQALMEEAETALDFETQLVRSDGQTIWVLENARAIRNADGQVEYYRGSLRDITERKRAEEALHRVAKLESLGILAGGVAHDFNNMLAAMKVEASIVQHKLASDDPAVEHLKRAMSSMDRAADLAGQMLAYSGRGHFEVTRVDLNELIKESSDLLQASVTSAVRLKLDLLAGLPTIKADATQLEQVIMNLVINAAEACDDAGTVEIKTWREVIGDDYAPGYATGESLAPGEYVCMQVSDNGIGIEADALGQLFDPFFSTKAVGRGLGLSAVLGIVRGHQGDIQVTSQAREGTTFKVLLPAAKSARLGDNESEE